MPTAAKLNDKGTQHDGHHETVSIASYPTVFIGGLPATRMNNLLTPQDKPEHPPIRIKARAFPERYLSTYIDEHASNFGNSVNRKRLNLIACVELVSYLDYIEFIKKQDRYLYKSNAGVGSVIRPRGQKKSI